MTAITPAPSNNEALIEKWHGERVCDNITHLQAAGDALAAALEAQAAKVTELEAELTEERDTFDLLDKAFDEKAAEVAKLTAERDTARTAINAVLGLLADHNIAVAIAARATTPEENE